MKGKFAVDGREYVALATPFMAAWFLPQSLLRAFLPIVLAVRLTLGFADFGKSESTGQRMRAAACAATLSPIWRFARVPRWDERAIIRSCSAARSEHIAF